MPTQPSPELRHRRPMEDDRLKQIVKTQISHAAGRMGGAISEHRRRAMNFYYGERIGNEVKGRSQVVSMDVSDTIEAIMPDVVRLFTAGDDVVVFEPENPEDEEMAEQATDLVNHIWNKDNNGFNLFYDWFKDALLQVNGFVKIIWEEREESKEYFYTGLTEDEVSYILADAEQSDVTINVLEHETYSPLDEEITVQLGGLFGDLSDLMLHDIKIQRIETGGRIVVMTVPPEEFLIERRARSIASSTFHAHKCRKTASDLIEMGIDPDLVNNLPSTDEQEYNEERIARYTFDDEWPYDEDYPDASTRYIWIYDCYIKLDYDGDGIAELRRVMCAGPGYEILINESAEISPFVAITPIRMPHKFWGRSVYELIDDIQLIKTQLWRQSLDNLYNQNNARAAVSNKVSLDDYLNNRVGGVIQVDTDMGDVGGHIEQLKTMPVLDQTMPMMEYADNVRESRTGIYRRGQSLDENALHDTKWGLNQLLGMQQERILLIAQVFAEGGVKDAMALILKLVIQNQQKPRVIRLRNQWVEMDPRSWNANMDVSIDVGLGSGTHEGRLMGVNMLLERQVQAAEYQGGLNGPLVEYKHVYHSLKELTKKVGYRNVDAFWNDVDDPEAQAKIAQMQAQGPPPDPDVIKAQAQIQLDQQSSQNDAQIQREKAQLDAWEARQKAELDRQKAEWEFQLKVWQANVEAGLEREKFVMEASLKEEESIAKQFEGANGEMEMGEDVALDYLGEGLEAMAGQLGEATKAISEAVANLNRPKRIEYGEDGRISGVSVG